MFGVGGFDDVDDGVDIVFISVWLIILGVVINSLINKIVLWFVVVLG